MTERILEEATLRLVHTHLPTLCDAGLVQETDGSVELTPDPTLPYKEWLAMTAAVEFEAVESRDQWRERRGTADRHDEQLAYDEQANDFRSSLIGTTQ